MYCMKHEIGKKKKRKRQMQCIAIESFSIVIKNYIIYRIFCLDSINLKLCRVRITVTQKTKIISKKFEILLVV